MRCLKPTTDTRVHRRNILGASSTFSRVFSVMTMLAATVPSGQAEQYQFDADVPRVRVDVVVTDAHGDIVRGLGVSDFVLSEDGKVQEVVDVQFIDARVAPTHIASRNLDYGADGSFQVPDKATRVSPAASAPDLGAMVFVVDFEGLDWLNKERFGDAMMRLLAQRDMMPLPWAIYMVDQVGHLVEIAPLTSEVAELTRAMDKIRATPLVRQSKKDELIAAGGQGQAGRRYDAYAERTRSITTFRRLAQFADSLSVRQGRTTLVWVSSGVQLLDRPSLAARGGAFATPWPQVLNAQREFHRAANTGNVSVYAVDPSRLVDLIPDTSDVRHGPVAPGGALPLQRMAYLRPLLDAMRDSLREAARATGGRAFVAWANLQDVVKEIEHDSTSYYLLTYRPPPPHGDGKFHNIRVKVNRPNLKVRARSGYVDYSDDERRRRRIAAALALPGTTSGPHVSARLYRAWLPDGTASVLLVAKSGGQRDSVPQAMGPGSVMEAFVIVVTPSGDSVAEASGYALRVGRSPDGVGGGGEASSFTFQQTFTLSPGEYSVRVAFRDQATNQIGATSLSLNVPAVSADEWRASDPLMLFVDSDGNRRPAFGSSLTIGERLIVVLEVYNGTTPRVRGSLLRIGSTKSLASPGQVESTELPVTLLGPVSPGLHRGSITLPELPAGEYVLELFLSDSRTSQGRRYEFIFTVAER